MVSQALKEDLRLPVAFRVGVTGHRHLREDAIAPLRKQIRDCLTTVQDQIARRTRDERVAAAFVRREERAEIQIVSPLAEGADRLVAEEGLKLGAELRAPLPFAAAVYEFDFPDSVDVFRALLAQSLVFTLDGVRDEPTARLQSYQNVGHFVVRNCDLLIAIWDGRPERGVGGTAEIVRFAVASGLPVWLIDESGAAAPRLLRGHADLVALHDAPIGPAAEAALQTFVDQCVVPPEAEPAELGGLFGWIAKLGGDAAEVSPLQAFLDEKPLPRSALWKAHAWMMSWISPHVAGDPIEDQAPRSELETYWRNRCRLVDAASNGYGERYRSSYVLIALLAVAALSAAAATGETPSGIDIVFILVELLSLVGIAALVLANHRRGWHERWISYRLLAELYRKQFALCAIGRALSGSDVLRLTFDSAESDLAPREAWVAWYFMGTMRAAGFPQGEMIVAKRRAVEIGRSLLSEQIGYHKSRLERMRLAGERIGSISELFFALVVLLALAKFLGALGDFGSIVHWGGVAGAFLSAFAGACVGIRAYAEFSMLARQSAYMVRVLEQAKTELDAAALAVDHPLSSVHLGRTLQATTAAMMQDITGWANLFRIKTIEAG